MGTRDAETVSINLKINGANYDLKIEPRVSLLDALREYIGLTGTKKGCDQGACGACTVLVDGERINSCLALAVQYQGREITTIEGVADDDQLHALQAAFIESDGFHVVIARPDKSAPRFAMVAEFKQGMPSALTGGASDWRFSDEEIKERMSGNLCRCGAYVGIVEAIRDTFAEEVAR